MMSHSIQYLYFIKYINQAILANLQHRPLKLDRLIVLQEYTPMAIKSSVPMATHSFPVPTYLFSMLVIFSCSSAKRGLKIELTDLYACWIMHMKHHMKMACQRWPEMP